MARIALVDDDRTSADLLKLLLQLDGHTAVICRDVEQARGAATTGVDAFIVDIRLANDQDGLDLLRAIRRGETAARADTPVIITSGDYRRATDAQAAGASRFIRKPFSPETISEVLGQLLS
ncbi:MAG: response regulator [Chloroflexota bacterium]